MAESAVAAEAQARAALRADPVTAPLATASFEPVPGGLSNFAWHVAAPGGDCFVRYARRHDERLGADHANECRVLELTSRAGLSPQVLRCAPAARLLVTRWVPTPRVGRPLRDAAAVRAVARALAQLHSLPAPLELRTVQFETQAQGLEAAVGRDTLDLALREAATAVFAALRECPMALVLCHHDLNPLNLLCEASGRLWFVDWEYAGRGDRAFDLASFAAQHGLDARQRRGLVAAYRDAGGTIDAAQFGWALWAFDYVQWLWYRAAGAEPEGALDRALAAARVARLARSLRGRASRVLRCNNAAFGE